MRLEPKVTDSGLVTLTNGKYSTTATDTYTTPVDAQALIDASITDLQDATEVQGLIDTAIADLPTNAEAETIAEGVVAAAKLNELTAPDGSVNFADQQALSFRIENRTSDPASPTVGQVWLRTDL